MRASAGKQIQQVVGGFRPHGITHPTVTHSLATLLLSLSAWLFRGMRATHQRYLNEKGTIPRQGSARPLPVLEHDPSRGCHDDSADSQAFGQVVNHDFAVLRVNTVIQRQAGIEGRIPYPPFS